MHNSLNAFCTIITVAVISFCADAYTTRESEIQREEINASISTSALWREPGHIESLDLFYGPGGPKSEPAGTFTFVKEIMTGVYPKFEVVDRQGVHWIAKLGDEAKSETAATRLLWAVGYFADEAYYVPELRVEQMPELARGSKFVKDGVVQSVRLERKYSLAAAAQKTFRSLEPPPASVLLQNGRSCSLSVRQGVLSSLWR
jgi:hypothetical protein